MLWGIFLRYFCFWLLPLAAFGAAPDKLNSAWLLSLIDKNQSKSISETLSIVKQNAPRLLENHFLVHSSMSCQGSSLDKPRAILFSDDGELTLTFTDEAPAETAFEISEYDPLKKTIRFYDLDFSKKNDGKPYHFTEPADCLRCHGGATPKAPAKLLTGISGFFSSIYGSYNDQLLIGSNESDGYLRFLSLAPKSATYRHLLNLPSPNELRKNNTTRKTYRPHSSDEEAPYLRFTKEARKINLQRFLWMLEDHPKISQLKAAVLAALLDCDDIDSFFASTNWFSEKSYDEILRAVKEGIGFSYRFNLEMIGENNPIANLPDWHRKHATRVAKLIRVLEPSGHFSLDDWSMENIRNGYAFGERDGSSILDRLIPLFVAHFYAEGEPEWQDLKNHISFPPSARFCSSLKKESLLLTASRKE